MSDESPWQYVQRRRREGAKDDTLRRELLTRGVDFTELQLLLDRAESFSVPGETVPRGTTESAWSALTRMRAEGFPREAIEAELTRAGYARNDIAALFTDDPMAIGPGQRLPDVAAPERDWPAIGLGILLIALALSLFASGRVSLAPFSLVLAGAARLATALYRPPRTALEGLTIDSLRPLPDHDARARCHVHQKFASVATCSRCGAFCCARCLPRGGLTKSSPCLRCQRSAGFMEHNLESLKRRATLRLIIGPITASTIIAINVWASFPSEIEQMLSSSPLLRFLMALAWVPWLVLMAVQAFSRSLWPTWLSVPLWALQTFLFTPNQVFTESTPAYTALVWLFAFWPALAAWRDARRVKAPVEPLIPEEEPAPAQ